jgi:hypothetical protein
MSEVKTNKISSLASNNDITIDPDGTGDVVVASGRLGIATSSPDSTLHVHGSFRQTGATAPFEWTVNAGAADTYKLNAVGYADNLLIATSTGKVGIGCTPTTKFQVQGASNANNIEIGGDFIQSFNRSGSPGYQSLPIFASDFKLYTAGSERLRIDASGRLLMGVTGPTNGGESFYVDAFDGFRLFCSRGSTALREQIVFHNPNGDVGSIDTDGSSTSYNTSSDYRLKEAVVDMTGAIDRVKALAPKRFNFIADPDDTTVDGFLAHEAQAVVPEAVTGTHNETRTFTNVVLSSDGKLLAQDVAQADWTAGKLATTDVNGNAVDALYPSDSTWSASHDGPVMQGIDQSKLVPLLTGALQEAIAKIETLETKVAALEAGE